MNFKNLFHAKARGLGLGFGGLRLEGLGFRVEG